ncbi:hypothetical protein [Catenulispora pinisilvae]|uniref:hypothetical protein n=1 Tax=Catenulispora pinisilvae TaxID=2705253 RepID=UPI001891A4E3|nr:hypothetical protein [Catenulispora pinisilvae]
MQENPKPVSAVRQVAHVAGYLSFTTAGVSLAGAVTTAEAGGAVHTVFAVGSLGSLLAMLAAIAVHGPDVLRCRRCIRQNTQALGEVPTAADEQPALDAAEPVSSQAWWAA